MKRPLQRALHAVPLLLILLFAFPVMAEEDESTTVFNQGEVIVTGQKTPAEKVSSIEEIDAEDIKAMGARNAAEALRLAAGARVDLAPSSISANGKQEWLGSLRGFDPRNVIVLIDGVPVYEPYFRVLDLRQIPVGDIAKIKIIKGPTSVLYGPNALGGVINIITKKGAGKPKAHLQGAYGNVDRFSGDGSVLGGANGFEYFFAPGFEKSDGFPVSADFDETRNEDGGLRENSDYQDFYLSGKFGYGQGLHGITLSANHYQFEGGVPFSMEAVEPGTLWRKKWEKTTVALHGETGDSDFFHAKVKGFYTRFYNTITTYEDASMSAIVDDGDAISTYDNDVAGFILMPQFILGAPGTISLSGIYKYDSVSVQDETGGEWFDFGAETASAGAEYQASVWQLDFTAGSAYNFYRRTQTPGNDLGDDNSAIDYQAGLAFTPLDQMQLYSAIAHKSSFPDLKTLYSSNGNPDLKPEYAINVDAGFRLNPWSFLSAEGTWFYSDVTDLIGKKDTGNTYFYENIDSAKITGAEGFLSTTFLKGMLSLAANYTYMQTKDERPDRKLDSLDYRPEQKATFDGRLNLPFGTRFSLQYFYVGERKYEMGGVDPKIKTLPQYGLTNARISHTLSWDDGKTECELFIEGQNLFDVYYEVSPEKAPAGRTLSGGLAFDF